MDAFVTSFIFTFCSRCFCTGPRKSFLLALGAVFAAGIVLGKLGGHLPVWATVATDPILFEFYFGALLAFLFVSDLSLPRGFAIALIALAVTALALTGIVEVAMWTRLLCWGLPAAAILFGAVSLERTGVKTPKLPCLSAHSSYSLYLIHPFVLPVFGKSWAAMHLSDKISPVIPAGLLAFGCALLAGHIVYLFFEKLIIGYLSRAWRGHRSPFSERLEENVAP